MCILKSHDNHVDISENKFESLLVSETFTVLGLSNLLGSPFSPLISLYVVVLCVNCVWSAARLLLPAMSMRSSRQSFAGATSHWLILNMINGAMKKHAHEQL